MWLPPSAGLIGGILTSLVAFSPSFAFILLSAPRFDQVRGNRSVRAFPDGAGPAAIGAIFGSAIPHWSLTRHWQFAVLAAALIVLLALRRGGVLILLCAAAAGVIIGLTGGQVHLPPSGLLSIEVLQDP